jgi:hypothetical protein
LTHWIASRPHKNLLIEEIYTSEDNNLFRGEEVPETNTRNLSIIRVIRLWQVRYGRESAILHIFRCEQQSRDGPDDGTMAGAAGLLEVL